MFNNNMIPLWVIIIINLLSDHYWHVYNDKQFIYLVSPVLCDFSWHDHRWMYDRGLAFRSTDGSYSRIMIVWNSRHTGVTGIGMYPEYKLIIFLIILYLGT